MHNGLSVNPSNGPDPTKKKPLEQGRVPNHKQNTIWVAHGDPAWRGSCHRQPHPICWIHAALKWPSPMHDCDRRPTEAIIPLLAVTGPCVDFCVKTSHLQGSCLCGLFNLNTSFALFQ